MRLGSFTSAGVSLLPLALTALRRSHPSVTVVTREASTPALVRALRSGTVELVLLSSRPPYRAPDTEAPALHLRTLVERGLRVAVPLDHPLALGKFIEFADLHGQRWIASPSVGGDRRVGVWPGLDERPEIAHSARDWLVKLQLVAAGCGLTTVSPGLASAAPPGVCVLPVRGGPDEQRRILLARLPGPVSESAARLTDALARAVAQVGAIS